MKIYIKERPKPSTMFIIEMTKEEACILREAFSDLDLRYSSTEKVVEDLVNGINDITG